MDEQAERNVNAGGGTGPIIREVIESAKDLTRDEISLFKAELAETAKAVAKHSAQAALFGALTALSIVPFLAFCVLGLGNLMDGNYWLSSLIVAIAAALIGGILARRALMKIRVEDIQVSHTRESLERELRLVRQTLDEVKNKRRNV